MILNRDLIKEKLENSVLEFIKSNSELESIIEEKYLDYISILNYNPNTKAYIFNMIFHPKENGPSVTIPFSFDDDLKVVCSDNFVKIVMNILTEE
jgi:hypothetical protein